jgi:dihydrofolate synthase/folylpolyglutamate synthase
VVGLLGRHQAANAAVAIALLDALQQAAESRDAAFHELDDLAIRRGFAAARWPGRLELLRRTPFGPVLLDGAHNPDGARALAASLADLGVRDVPMVFGATRGKRVAAVLRALAPLRPRPVFTRVVDPGAMEPEALLRTWRRVGRGGRLATDPATALAAAAELRRGSDQPVLVAGSLYLVGAVRGMLTDERSDA